ncbi:MAG: tetratricopeptide repeat protein [bacterium]|nr:tetratricopeptide repeat protein [bacterium]
MLKKAEPSLTPERVIRRGLNYFHKEAYAEASHYFSKSFAQLNPKQSGELRDQLQIHFNAAVKARRWAEAAAVGVPLFEAFAKDFELANRVGNAYRRQNMTDLAADWYQKALELNPRYLMPRYNLAALDAQVDKYDHEAKALLERFSKVREFFLPGYLGSEDPITELRASLEKTQRTEQVEQLTEQIRKKALSGSLEEIEEALALCGQADELETAPFEAGVAEMIDCLSKRAHSCLFLTPSNPAFRTLESNLVNLGLYAMKHQEIEQAVEALEQIKAKESNYAYLDMLLSLCKARQGRMEEAANDLKILAETHSEDRYINANLGLLYKEMGNKRAATRYLMRASASVEETEGIFCPTELKERALQLNADGHSDTALEYLTVSVQHLPRVETWLALASVSLDAGQLVMAEDALVQATALAEGPKGPDKKVLEEACRILHNKADQLRRANRLPEAAQAYVLSARYSKELPQFERAIKLFRNLEDNAQAGKVEKEMYEMQAQLLKDASNNRFDNLMSEGREALSNKDYQKAITAFENALEAQPDRQAFGYLVKIYQKLNHKRALNRLLQNWKWITEKGPGSEELAS